jgi:hypothetical protein
MNIEFRCPTCQRYHREDLVEGSSSIACGICRAPLTISCDRFRDHRLTGCLLCPGRELFQRKDFSQRVGVTIVVLGFTASCVTWYFHQVMMTYAILFLTAFVDVLLYLVVGNVLECYNCHTIYRGADVISGWGTFQLETQERFRQQQLRRAAVAVAEHQADRQSPFQAGGT